MAKSKYLTINLGPAGAVPTRRSSPVGATVIGDYIDAHDHQRKLVLERPDAAELNGGSAPAKRAKKKAKAMKAAASSQPQLMIPAED